jgi:hypothetical protein
MPGTKKVLNIFSFNLRTVNASEFAGDWSYYTPPGVNQSTKGAAAQRNE